MAVSTLHPEMRQAPEAFDWSTCRSDGICHPSNIALEVLGEPGHSVRGDMFVYLFRRFGYPIVGWDDAKSVVWYALTTPDPDVLLTVDPASRVWLSFGYGLSPAIEDAAHDAYFDWRNADPRPGEWEEYPIYLRIQAALEASLRELLRPVLLRSTALDLFGVKTDAQLAEWPYESYAKRSPQAGYGLGDFDPVKAYGGGQ